MLFLIFGLPGAGKTTLVKGADGVQLHLDLGHNAFKSTEARTKFYQKLMKFTTGLIPVMSNYPTNIYLDSYPQYFSLTDLQGWQSRGHKFQVIFMVPAEMEGVDVLVERVKHRDGVDSEFAKLYSKQGHAWWSDWQHIIQDWIRTLGKRNVQVVDPLELPDVKQL